MTKHFLKTFILALIIAVFGVSGCELPTLTGGYDTPDEIIPGILAPGVNLAAKLAWLNSAAMSDSVYLLEVRADETINAHNLYYTGRENITIKLTGIDSEQIITLSGQGSLFTVGESVTLELHKNITLKGHDSNNAALVTVNSGGTLLMENGSAITGNTNTSGRLSSHGGGVFVNGEGAYFEMLGGIITGNSISNASGGGVGVINNATFSMKDGTISGNSAFSGGAVLVYTNSASFTMSGGTIRDNFASNYGGGIYVHSDAAITMSGGEISNNSALLYNGGGIALHSNSVFTMSDGTITDNSAPIDSDVFVYENCTFNFISGDLL